MKKFKVAVKKIINSYKGNSLRMRFLAFTLACWVIPVLTVGFSSFFVYRSYKNEIQKLALSETDYAAEFCYERLITAYDICSDATFDKVVEENYAGYLSREIGKSDLNKTVKRYINNKYLGEAFCMADIVFDNESGIHHYLGTTDLCSWEKYYKSTYAQLVEFSNDLGSKTGICIIDNDVYIVRKLIASYDASSSRLEPNKPFGIFVLQVDGDYLFEHFKSNDFWDGSLAFKINNYTGTVGKCATSDLKNASGDVKIKYLQKNNKSVIYGGKHTEYSAVSFGYALYPSDESSSSAESRYSFIMIAVLLLTIPVMAMGTYSFYNKINKPIQQLIKAMQSIEAGNLEVAVSYDREDEFKYLIDNFNNMSHEIKFLFDYTYKEELALKDARLLALQSQINPHFLNNTLEMMNWKARLSGQEELSHMIEALSTIFDAGMNRSRQQLVPLSEELKCVDAYIFIISKRLGDRLKVIKNIDTSLEQMRVPPLIIQPLVENAVLHGVEPAGGGTVELNVFARNGEICVEVENDGAVVSDEDVERIKGVLRGEIVTKRQSLGIKNVNERLKLLYGDDYGLSIFRSQKGTTVSKISIGKEEFAKIYN